MIPADERNHMERGLFMITLPANWSDWKISREIGHGSYSSVYEAVRQDDPAVRCAIKLISVPQDKTEYDELVAEGFTDELSRSFFEEAVRDLTREIQVMERFKGMQNIVSIEDYKVVPREDGIGSHIFIRMELLTSLDQYLSDKILTEAEILQIGIDICTALEFCHAKKIVHRDIKPANIFVNDHLGTHVFFKLGDFGIARNLEGKTQNMSVRGTPNYMAPEVAANLPYDASADQYSLGLCLYYLLNGNRLPFYPQTQLYSPSAKRDALARRLSGEVLEAPINASPKAAEVILKACSFKPADRYATVSDMKQALQAITGKEPQPQQADDEPASVQAPPEGREKHRSRLRLILAVLIVLAGAAILVKTLIPTGRENPAGSTPSAVPPTSESSDAPANEKIADASSPEAETGTTETIETAPAEKTEDNQITRLFDEFQPCLEPVQAWTAQLRPDHIMLPDTWDQIPYGMKPENAPEASALIQQEEIRIFFSDVPSHGRKVFLVPETGTQTECIYDPEKDCYTLPVSDETAGSATALLVCYMENNIRQEFTYQLSGDRKLRTPECVSSRTAYTFGKYTIAFANETKGHTCEIQSADSTVHIAADYPANDLSTYRDLSAELFFDREGYPADADGNPVFITIPEDYLFPVILYSDFPARQQDTAHDLVRQELKAALESIRIIRYQASARIYLPRDWNEFPLCRVASATAPTLQATAISDKDEGTVAYDITVDLPEDRWKLILPTGEQIDLSKSGGTYRYSADGANTGYFTLQTHLIDGISYDYLYLPTSDGDCPCFGLRLACSLNYRFEPVASGSSEPTVYSSSDPDLPHYLLSLSQARMEDQGILYGYYTSSTSSGTMALTDAEYAASLTAEKGKQESAPFPVARASLTLIDGESFNSFDFSYSELQDDNNLWIKTPKNTILHIDTAINQDIPAPVQLRDLSDESSVLLEQAETYTLQDGRTAVRIINRSDSTYQFIDSLGRAGDNESDCVLCFPSLIPSGGTAYLVSGSGFDSAYFAKNEDRSLVFPEVQQEEHLTEESLEGSAAQIEFSISNPSDRDVFLQGWYCLIKGQDGTISNIIYPQYYDHQYQLYLPAGEKIPIYIEASKIKGECEFYAWGYQ